MSTRVDAKPDTKKCPWPYCRDGIGIPVDPSKRMSPGLYECQECGCVFRYGAGEKPEATDKEA